MSVVETETLVLECRLSRPARQISWCRDGKVLGASDRVEIIRDLDVHRLIIKNVKLADAASYTVMIGEDTSVAQLVVTGEDIVLSVFVVGLPSSRHHPGRSAAVLREHTYVFHKLNTSSVSVVILHGFSCHHRLQQQCKAVHTER